MSQQNANPEKRDNSGYLFENKQKTTDKQPDLRGKVTISGKEYYISGWKRSKNGEMMISLAVTDPAQVPVKSERVESVQGGGQKAPGAGFGATNTSSSASRGTSFGAQNGGGTPVPAHSNDSFPDLDDLEDLFNNS